MSDLHLKRVEEKLDELLRLNRLEQKLDLLVQNAVDEQRVRQVTHNLQHSTRKLSRAIERAGKGLPDEQSVSIHPLQETPMSTAVDHLEATVAANSSVIDSAVELLGKLSGLIRATAGDTTKVNALADELDAKKQALADAVVANTPAEPSAPGGPAPSATPKKK